MHSQDGEIVIDPVTRIEGHSKITISLDAAGAVSGWLILTRAWRWKAGS